LFTTTNEKSANYVAEESAVELCVMLADWMPTFRCQVLVEAPRQPERTLSPREEEIARMVGQGYPNKTIAANLGISSWTVSMHLRRMFAKFGVRSRAALVAAVLERRGLSDERGAVRSEG
jgi:DNA-binding CsgD family transcriptional regulator